MMNNWDKINVDARVWIYPHSDDPTSPPEEQVVLRKVLHVEPEGHDGQLRAIWFARSGLFQEDSSEHGCQAEIYCLEEGASDEWSDKVFFVESAAFGAYKVKLQDMVENQASKALLENNKLQELKDLLGEV